MSYYWSIITAQDESYAFDERALPPSASLDVLLDEIRQVARSKGSEGLAALRALFIVLDVQSRVNDGKIDREDTKDCLRKWGLDLDNRYLDIAVSVHDRGTGLIDYRYVSLHPLNYSCNYSISYFILKLHQSNQTHENETYLMKLSLHVLSH